MLIRVRQQSIKMNGKGIWTTWSHLGTFWSEFTVNITTPTSKLLLSVDSDILNSCLKIKSAIIGSTDYKGVISGSSKQWFFPALGRASYHN